MDGLAPRNYTLPPTVHNHVQLSDPHRRVRRSGRRTCVPQSRPCTPMPYLFRRLDTVNTRPVEFSTEKIDMVNTKSSRQWATCDSPAQQGAILKRAIAHLDDWEEALRQERERHIAWSAARYQQAQTNPPEYSFILVAEHWIHAAEAARFDKSRRSWAAIRKLLDRMRDNRNQCYRVVLARRRGLTLTNEDEALLESLERRLKRDARRAETLARTDNPIKFPQGI